MPQLIFTATVIMLILLAIVIIVKLKVSNKIAIFISVFNKKWVSYGHIVPLKQNILFLFFLHSH